MRYAFVLAMTVTASLAGPVAAARLETARVNAALLWERADARCPVTPITLTRQILLEKVVQFHDEHEHEHEHGHKHPGHDHGLAHKVKSFRKSFDADPSALATWARAHLLAVEAAFETDDDEFVHDRIHHMKAALQYAPLVKTELARALGNLVRLTDDPADAGHAKFNRLVTAYENALQINESALAAWAHPQFVALVGMLPSGDAAAWKAHLLALQAGLEGR